MITAATLSAPTTGRRAALALPPLSAVQMASGASIDSSPSMSPVAAAVMNCSVISAVRRGVDGLEPLAPRMHVLAGAVRDLAHRRHGFADRACDFVVVEAEHLAQDEHRPLVGGERLEQHQHRHRHRLGEHDVGRGVALVEQQWLGQPRADVVLATTGARPQRVERLPGHQLRQIRLGVAHRREVDVGPPQIAVLQHVVGFRCGAQDLVDDREQQRPQMGEPLGVLGRPGHDSVTTSNVGWVGRFPPFITKVEPGLRASRRSPHSVPLQMASFTEAARRPPM